MKLYVLFLSALIFMYSCSSSVNPKMDNTDRIVFSSLRDTHYQIYTVNPDGSDVRQITFFRNYNAFTPRWSPDKSRIVFASDSLGTTAGNALYIMNADGTNIHPVKWMPGPLGTRMPLEGRLPSWSPDGNTIIYNYCSDGEGGIFSPDGQKILFSSNRDHINERVLHPHLYIMNADGSNQTRLMPNFTQSSGGGRWSHDGKTIIFTADNGQLYSYSLATKKRSKLEVGMPNLSFFTQAWSREDEKILLLGSVIENGRILRSIYIYTFTSKDIIKILPDNDVDLSDW